MGGGGPSVTQDGVAMMLQWCVGKPLDRLLVCALSVITLIYASAAMMTKVQELIPIKLSFLDDIVQLIM